MLQLGIELVQAAVQTLAPERGQVLVGDNELSYDYLVIALGADQAPALAPGYVGIADQRGHLRRNLRFHARFQGLRNSMRPSFSNSRGLSGH